MDDGSTEVTRTFLKDAMDELGVEYLQLEHCGHPGVVRKKGVEILNTTWVAFLDSDDEWLPMKTELQLKELAKSGNSAICSNAKMRSDGKLYFSKSPSRSMLQRKDLYRVNSVICSTALVKRKVLNQIKNFADERNVRGAEDFATWLRVSMFTNWDYIGEPLIWYSDASEDSLRKDVSRLTKSPHLLGLKNFSNWALPEREFALSASIAKASLLQLFGR